MVMSKHDLLVFLALSIVMLVGDARAQSPTDVSGTWTGSTLRGASTVTLVLKQEGQNVSGTLSGAGVTDDGPITGTVDGSTLRLQSKTGATPSLSVKGNEISGLLNSGLVTLRRAN